MNNVGRAPIADVGGRKVLNMPGSLSGYIRTGNQFAPQYNTQDSLKLQKKQKRRRITDKIMSSVIVASLALSTGVLAYKGKLGNFAKNNIDKLVKKDGELIFKKINFKSIGDFFTTKFQALKNHLPKVKAKP